MTELAPSFDNNTWWWPIALLTRLTGTTWPTSDDDE